MRTAEDRRWFAAVATIECCVLCGQHGTQVAHRNEGKGMALKVSADQTAAICRGCHYEIDSGATFTREERRARMDKAIVLTHHRLVVDGLLVLADQRKAA